MEPSGLTLFASSLFLACLLPVAIWPSRTLRWFQRKRYQYEVTFGLYMLTATEKFILSMCMAYPLFMRRETVVHSVQPLSNLRALLGQV